MRKISIAPEEHYHIYNKSVSGDIIFHENRDYARFLFLILFFQSPLSIRNTKRHVDYFIRSGDFGVDTGTIAELIKTRLVELIAFAIMPNHFHILLREIVGGGISRYVQRIAGGYAKYTQIKYGDDGHLFRGPFGATLVASNTQLLHLSSYIHRNPRELRGWKNREHEYRWSSYQDYIKENRWGKLLAPGIVLDQFNSPAQYQHFVETSTAKEKKMLDYDLLFPSPY